MQYSPGNSHEGRQFELNWCEQCIRNPKSPEAKHQCQHLLMGFVGEDNGVWIWRDGEPVCTAYRNRKERYLQHLRKKKDNPQLQLF